ncbi:MAG: glutamate synthase central domain-containing protein, partial [Spirochaetia bacterium]
MEQIFIAAADETDDSAFERALYLIRKQAQRRIRGGSHDEHQFFYICSLSTRVMVYKGMLMPEQLFRYFLDLADPEYETHLALVHSRFSTNTFPSWDRAQPQRFMSHNGEINTLQGNVNKMRAREGVLESELFGESLGRTFPVIEPDLSDSGTFDNVLELLLLSGRSLQEAVMMMIPEAWQNHSLMPDHGKAMYEYYSTLMEPWDGPASIAFTDGHVIGAVLDRNGLRPSRYYVTEDDRVIMASEAGVLDIEPENVRLKGRLQPGRMFLVDFDEGRLVPDEEIKDSIALSRPYRQWLDEQRIRLEDLPPAGAAGNGAAGRVRPEQGQATAAVNGATHADSGPAGGASPDENAELFARMRAFGYTVEHLNLILGPMAVHSKEQLGSMGNDTPLAALSDRPRLLYEYFKQLFAQVTNPPIDSIREDIIMSLSSYIGPQGNLLSVTPDHAHMLQLDHPVLTNDQVARIRHMNHRGWRTKTVDITYEKDSGVEGFMSALDRIAAESESAISEGYSLVVLSDRAASRERVALSGLLAVGTVHHHLVRNAKRTQIGLILESGEPRETHHFCCLVGYGADAINPYLAFEAMWYLKDSGQFATDFSYREIEERYIHALSYGMRKVFGKMGISTLDSYKGAQIFEAIGLKREVVDRCFAGTSTRVEGVGFDILAQEAALRHELGYPQGNLPIGGEFYNPGDYQWRAGGEKHMWDPDSVARMQIAARQNNWDYYRDFADRQNAREKSQATLRGLLKFKKDNEPISIDEVEPASEIVKRFATGAMSFGSISQEAHETLAIAMNRLGGKSNTGEGGELRERYRPLPNGDSKRSAIKQVASGRFGVTIEYLTESDELQIKMAQGAKPGEGGELPGHKVFDVIAKVRYSTPGVGLISPPPHHDIYSIEDLAQRIFDLKN